MAAQCKVANINVNRAVTVAIAVVVFDFSWQLQHNWNNSNARSILSYIVYTVNNCKSVVVPVLSLVS